MTLQFKIKFFEGDEKLNTMRKRMKYINSADARMASLLVLNGLANIPFITCYTLALDGRKVHY